MKKQDIELNLTGFALHLMRQLSKAAIINIKPKDIRFQDKTPLPNIAEEMQKLYAQLAKQGIVPNAPYMQELSFFAKLLDEGALFLERLLNTPANTLTKLRFQEFYRYYIKNYTNINPEKLPDKVIHKFANDTNFKRLLAKLLYFHIVIASFNKYRRNVIWWRRSIIHNDIDNTIPLELKTYLLLSNVPVVYKNAFAFRPQTPGVMRLVSDLSTFEIEVVLIMAIYVLVLLNHPRKDVQGAILSGSYQDAIDLLSYISPMLYMLGFFDFANYARSKALEFLYAHSGHYKELQRFKNGLKEAKKYTTKIIRSINSVTKNCDKVRESSVVYRIKKAGSALEKLFTKNENWLADVIGLTLIIEDANWYDKNGLNGLLKYIFYLIDNLPNDIHILRASPGDPDIQINWGSKQDVIKLAKKIRNLKGVTHIKTVLTKTSPGISFIYKNIRFTLQSMLDSGYEAAHISLYANHNFGAEIKIMTRRVYNYQKFGLGAHFLYKLKLDISKRKELVQGYRDRNQITRTEFFEKANQTVADLGFTEAQQRGARFLHYLNKHKKKGYGYSSPQNLYKTVGYIEQNYP